MQTPGFILAWLRRMPYHQIAELTVWMDAQQDVKKAIERAIAKSLEDEETIVEGYDLWS